VGGGGGGKLGGGGGGAGSDKIEVKSVRGVNESQDAGRVDCVSLGGGHGGESSSLTVDWADMPRRHSRPLQPLPAPRGHPTLSSGVYVCVRMFVRVLVY